MTVSESNVDTGTIFNFKVQQKHERKIADSACLLFMHPMFLSSILFNQMCPLEHPLTKPSEVGKYYFNAVIQNLSFNVCLIILVVTIFTMFPCALSNANLLILCRLRACCVAGTRHFAASC